MSDVTLTPTQQRNALDWIARNRAEAAAEEERKTAMEAHRLLGKICGAHLHRCSFCLLNRAKHCAYLNLDHAITKGIDK